MANKMAKFLAKTKLSFHEIGQKLLSRLGEVFSYFSVEDIEKPALHGDSWSGNFSFVNGKPYIFDPACYVGHSESDLGIARMFGGFPRDYI